MPFIPSFYSLMDETAKVRADRVYHNNQACRLGQGIAGADRRPSTGGHHICNDCSRLNGQESAKRW